MQEKYQKAYTRVTEWKDLHHNSLETLPVYSYKKRIRDILFLDSGMETIKDIMNTQERINIMRKELWKSSNSLLTQFVMDPIGDLYKESSTQTTI